MPSRPILRAVPAMQAPRAAAAPEAQAELLLYLRSTKWIRRSVLLVAERAARAATVAIAAGMAFRAALLPRVSRGSVAEAVEVVEVGAPTAERVQPAVSDRPVQMGTL